MNESLRSRIAEFIDSGATAVTAQEAQERARRSGTTSGRQGAHVTRRAPVVAAIAACLAVALVVGGSLLFAGSNDPPSVQTRSGNPSQETVPPSTAPPSTVPPCAGKAYVTNGGLGTGHGTVSVIETATGAASATITVGHFPGWVAICPA
jgi:YVTN family beta-propeller protein